MKRTHQKLTLAGTVLATALALPAVAAEPHMGWYFNADAGLNLASDIRATVGGISGDAELDPGLRLGVGVGYHVHKFVGVEFDTGWTYNQFDGSSDSLSHIPFMVNGVFRYPNESKWTPYAGIGVGGAYSILSLDAADDSDGDIGFAWQAVAGVRYALNDRMSIGAGYKYLDVAKTDYDFGGVGIKLGHSRNHSFNFVFQMNF